MTDMFEAIQRQFFGPKTAWAGLPRKFGHSPHFTPLGPARKSAPAAALLSETLSPGSSAPGARARDRVEAVMSQIDIFARDQDVQLDKVRRLLESRLREPGQAGPSLAYLADQIVIWFRTWPAERARHLTLAMVCDYLAARRLTPSD